MIELQLFEVPIDNPEALLRYGSALVQGSSNVFCSISLKKLPWFQATSRKFLCRLEGTFFFFFSDHMLESFLEPFPDFPNSFLLGGPADIFVIELADQLQKLKVEPVLLH